MSLEIVDINAETLVVSTRVFGTMKQEDMTGYFPTLASSIPENAGYAEMVDFCGVDSFELGYAEFSIYTEQAQSVYCAGRVNKVVFTVCNIVQFGMARMFSTIAIDEGIEIAFNRRDINEIW